MRRVCLMLALCCLMMIPPAGADPRPFLDLDFEAPECTSDWSRLGPSWRAYDSLYDQTQASSGRQSLQIRYTLPISWAPQLGAGSMAQLFPTEQAAGRKLRFSGSIRTEGAPIYAGLLWVAIDQAGGVIYGRQGAEGAGTTPWTRYEIELDIPANLQQTYFGVELVGAGTAWFDGLQIELDGRPWKDQAPHLFEPTPGHAAWLRGNALPLATAVAGNGSADLQALRQAFGDARIVSLGEGTHGTREFFQMKHRLLEFLVEEMGFTHFSIEASMPEAYEMNKYVLTGAGDPAALLKGLGYWVWNTQEVLDMILWMRQYNASGRGPVQFTGFDMNSASLAVPNVRSFLTQADPAYLPQAEPALARVREADRRNRATAADVAAARDLFAYLDGRREHYAASLPAEAVDWALQNARILVQLIEDLAGITSRDRSMAANVEWILDRAPAGSKIVLWAHNGHVNRAPGAMGRYLEERYGDTMYAVGFAFGEGRYNALGFPFISPHEALAPPPDTLDAFLGSAGLPRFFLDLRRLGDDAPAPWLYQPKRMRLIGASAARCAFYPTVVTEDYDGLIWINPTNPSSLLP